MQHVLLAIGIALIVAIAAALAAPAYVDWDDWRAAFEERATALAGTPVRIRGRIDATLLPTPAFTWRDVEAGDADGAGGVRADEVRGILSLGALLRGTIEAEEFVLVRPEMRLSVQGDGRTALRTLGAAAAGTADRVSFERIAVEDGSLAIVDRASGAVTVFNEISADGEVRARQGPMRLDASFLREGRRWRLRTNAGVFGEDGTGRVRLMLEREADGALFDAEGNLAIAGGVPRFEGKVTMARRGSTATPWQVTANAQATEENVTLDSFALTLGANVAATELTGEVRFEPRPGGAMEGSLTARRIDLDAAAGAGAPNDLPSALASAGDVLALLHDVPLRGRIGVSVDAVAAGGGNVRDLRTGIGLREAGVTLEQLSARLPGRATITANGAAGGGAIFAGEAAVSADDAAALARWAFGEAAGKMLEDLGPLQFGSGVKWTSGRVALERLELAYGEAKLSGQLIWQHGGGDRRARLEADLHGSGVDLDLFGPLVASLRGGQGAADVVLAFDGTALRALGRPLGGLDAVLSRTGEGFAIDRLVVDDFDGLSLRASGRVDAPVDRPSGVIAFEAEATRTGGLAELARRLVAEDAGALVEHMAAGGPLKLSGSVSGAGSAAGAEVAAQGTIGGTDATIAAHFDLLTEALSEARVTLRAQDAGRLVRLLGLSPGPPSPGEGELEIDLSSPGGGVMPVAARLSTPDAELAAEGALVLGADGRIEARLELKLDAADLRPLLAVAARASPEAPLPGAGGARLVRKSDAFGFESIDLTVGGVQVRGAISASAFDAPRVTGQLAIERMQVAQLLALVLGDAPASSAFWPAGRLDPAPLAGVTGTVDLEVKSLDLADQIVATSASFRLTLEPAEAALENVSAELAGGKVSGSARFIRGKGLGLDANMKLVSFEVARILAPGEGGAAARGRGDLTLTLAGNGDSPATLVSSLAGQGTLNLANLEIDRLDPNAVAAVFAATEEDTPPDEIDLVAALAPAFARGSLRIARIEAPLVVASGTVRMGKVTAQSGPAKVSASADLDLVKLRVDGAIEVQAPAPPGLTARPAATVRWRGPLAAPERGIEAAALATAITLRAMERETKRIEERDSALPQAKPRAADRSPTFTLPPLSPPVEIRPVPQPR